MDPKTVFTMTTLKYQVFLSAATLTMKCVTQREGGLFWGVREPSRLLMTGLS